jgi:hypothetical protein
VSDRDLLDRRGAGGAVRSATAQRRATTLHLSEMPEDVLRLLASGGDDAALAELARRCPDDKHLRLDAPDGETPPCHGYANCCRCPACEARKKGNRRR